MSSAGRWLRAGVTLALVPLLGVGACSGPAGPRPTTVGPSASTAAAPTSVPALPTISDAASTAERERVAGDLLRRRATAYERHDANALRAVLLDPTSSWGRSELAALGVFARLPVSRLATGTVRTSDLTSGPSDTAFLATVATSYRFAGYDSGDRTAETGFTVRRGAAGWRLAATDAAEGGPSTRLPWEMPGARVVRTGRALAVGAVDAAELARIAARAERAVDVVDSVWTARWPRRLVVLAPATAQDYRDQLGSSADADAQVAAVTDGSTGADGLAHADRVVLDPVAMAALQPDGRSVVLTHEALHVAMRASVAGRTPLWVSEGYAEVAGYRAPARRLPAAQVVGALREEVVAGVGLPSALPDDAAFGASAPSIAPAYNASWVAMTLLLERLGPARLTAFATAAASRGSDADVEDAAAAALRDRAGLDLATFTAQWRQRVATLSR